MARRAGTAVQVRPVTGAREAQSAGAASSGPAGPDLSPGRLRIAVSRISRLLRPTNAAGALTATEVDLLLVAVRRGPASMSEMATFCGVNPTMLSRMVPRLEDAGLLERHPGAEDRRVSLVLATPQARQMVGRVLSERDDALSLLLADLAPDEVAALAAATPVLEKLADRLRAQGANTGARR